MPRAYQHSKRKSAQVDVNWASVFPVAIEVLDRARNTGKQPYLYDMSDTSRDTWSRCEGSAGFGGWTGARILALINFERIHLGTSELSDAWNGAKTAIGNAGTIVSDSNIALCSVLDLSRKIAEFIPDGIDRIEARALAAILPDVIEALAVLNRDCKAALKAGV